MLLWQGPLSRFHLTKLDGSAALLCYLLPCSSRRPLEIVPSSVCQPFRRFCPSSACWISTYFVPGLRLPDRPVCCGCHPFQKSPSTRLSASLGSRMMAKVCTSAGFTLPASSFVEAPKSESIAVCRTVLSFRHRLGVFWVQTSSETHCLLQRSSSWLPF